MLAYAGAMRSLVLAVSLIFAIGVVQAQTVCVILSPDTLTVLQPQPPCNAGTSINTSDTRWVAYLAKLSALQANATFVALSQAQLALGIVLTSTGTSALNDTYPLDDTTQSNLQGIYSGIVNATFITASISGTTLTVSTTYSGAVAINQFLSGTGITPGTQITSGSNPTWTINNSQTVSSESMIAGGLGTGFPGSQSTVPLANLAHTAVHNFDPVHFMNYRNAVEGYLLQVLSPQVYAANGNTFPSNSVTIP
jgi:hypothetical protein